MISVFKKLFNGKIRVWDKYQILLLHLFSLFSPVNRIYKINKNIKRCFNYFFDSKLKTNPLKDDIYELQKNISASKGQEFKESLLKYYHDNDFLDLSLTFIDGHVIAYFGKESFRKLKHSTRNKIMKSLEVFNVSDKRGRIFYFKVDHDVEGMKKSIEDLINDVNRIIGLDKVKVLVFDRGSSSQALFHKLKNKYNLKFITLVVKSEKINEQINNFKKYNQFKKLNGKVGVRYLLCQLNIGQESFKALLIKNKDNQTIHPFITNIDLKELSNIELLESYPMHWNQEQEHNAFGKIGGNMHSKALQDSEFEDTTKIKKAIKYQNQIDKTNSKLIYLNLELRRIDGFELALTSKIKPKSKRTDNRNIRKLIKDYKKRKNEIIKEISNCESQLVNLQTKLDKIPENPKKRKFKSGPVDDSISITNLANNLNSKLIEIATNGKEKFQLATLIGSFYSISAIVTEKENSIYVKYYNLRQKKQIEIVQNLCDYFNPKNIKLRGKTLIFSIKSEKRSGKIKNTIF